MVIQKLIYTVFSLLGVLAFSAETVMAVPLPNKKPFAIPAHDSQARSEQTKFDGPAKEYFGAHRTPASLKAESYGSYAKGCIAGAVEMPKNGTTWQVMRLSRNRNWGHPKLVAFLQDLAGQAPSLGWNGLLVGDMSQPRGGPMLTGHASHQVGLDADIWLRPLPEKRFTPAQLEKVSAISMLKGPMDVAGADRSVDPEIWTPAHAGLIKAAAQHPEVARIFVSPAIKKELCEFETGENRDWLRTVRPWWGHHYHFHVRMKCPAEDKSCKNQPAPPRGDGCGSELGWWLSDEPWVPKPKKPGEKKKVTPKKPPLEVIDLPTQCTKVLLAN
ncbi:penicillin-insensitive murein endopeptidase [Flexibacterium corallicola]|uniref:penicillin-insensitive murein endopeptidase n=1 Tax=Flexibacterium corallicola TaxID=3037259 RepID=UPI00286ED132|nr:penicillin-insensitive murein endopeptidase [Pseudovibrio sp. M1P-2-3]